MNRQSNSAPTLTVEGTMPAYLDEAAAAAAERRALADRLAELNLTGSVKIKEINVQITAAESVEARSRRVWESDRKKLMDLLLQKDSILGVYGTPQLGIRRELERTQPPEINAAIEELYGHIGHADRLRTYETVPMDPNEPSAKVITRCTNGAAVERFVAGCRLAVERIELLRYEFSIDIAASIARIVAEIPQVQP